MKRRSCENNKSIRVLKKSIPFLREKFPHADIHLEFKKDKSHGSHCFNLILDTEMKTKKITVIKTNKSFNSNLGVIKKAEKFLDESLTWEIAFNLHN
jgi:ribosomal protein L7/L12